MLCEGLCILIFSHRILLSYVWVSLSMTFFFTNCITLLLHVKIKISTSFKWDQMKTEKSRQFSKSCLVIYYKLLTYVVRIFFGKVGTLKRSTKVKQSPVIYVRAWRVSSEKKWIIMNLTNIKIFLRFPYFGPDELFWSVSASFLSIPYITKSVSHIWFV